MKMSISIRSAIPAYFFLVALIVISAQQPTKPDPPSKLVLRPSPEYFEGTIREAGAGPCNFSLRINEWSTNEEMRLLAAMPRINYQMALADKLAQMKPKGSFRYRASDGFNIKVTQSFIEPSGTLTVEALSERGERFVPDVMGIIYCPFTLIVIRLDSKGNGSGRVFTASHVTFGPNGFMGTEGQSFRRFELLGVTSKAR